MENSCGQTLVNSTPITNPRVKIICSYGGRIQGRFNNPEQLTYSGGVNKLVTVDRNVKLDELIAKLTSLFETTEAFTVKYQMPGYDLDALVSVVDDDDVEHMMVEHELPLDNPMRRSRVRMFMFGPRIESEKSSASASSIELVFGFDEEDQIVVGGKSGGSDTPLAVSPLAMDLLQIPGMIVPGLSGSSFGSGDNDNLGTGACVSVSGGQSSSGSAGSDSDGKEKNVLSEGHVTDHVVPVTVVQTNSGSPDNEKNVESLVPCEGHVSGGACVSVVSGGDIDDKGKSVELQNQGEGQVTSGGCVYGVPVPVTTVSGGQTGYYTVPAVVNWDHPVFVPATVGVMRVNNSENQEVDDDTTNKDA